MTGLPWMPEYLTGVSETPVERHSVVFLHGFIGSARSVEPLLPHLSGRVLAPHLPGHHPHAPVSPTFEANVDWLARSLRAAGLSGVHLVGYSLGARTALGLALADPALVARLFLIGVHPGLADAAERAERARVDGTRAARLRRDGLAAFVAEWESLPLFATQSAAQIEAQRPIRLGREVEGLARSLERMGLGAMPDFGARWDELAMPVALVAGARDERFVAIGRRLAGAGLHEIPGAGHNVVLEAPAALAAIITA